MALPTLPDIPVSRSSRLSERPRIREAKFGDGYTQVMPDGINAMTRRYDARWQAVPRADADTLIAFFRARSASEPFMYQLPGEDAPCRWRCVEWSDQRVTPSHANVSAGFVEDFGP